MMDGFVVVAKKPDGSIAVFGSMDGIPFGTQEAAQAVANDPGKHLEPNWDCTVHRIIGLPE